MTRIVPEVGILPNWLPDEFWIRLMPPRFPTRRWVGDIE